MQGVRLYETRHLLVNYLRPQWSRVLLLSALLFGNIGLQLVNPQIMRNFIDTARGGSEAGNLWRSALWFMGVALMQQIVSVWATYVSERVGWTATNALRADLAEHCLYLDMSFHNARTPGEMIERIDGDVTSLSSFFSQFVIQVFGNVVLLVGVLILLFREDWRIGLALGVFAAVALAVLWRLRGLAKPHWEAEREASAEQYGFLEERLAGTEDIRSCGAKAYVMRRFFELLRDLMRKMLKAVLFFNIMVIAMMVLFAVSNAVAFAASAYLFQAGLITIGTVYIIFHYSNMVMMPINRITRQIQELQRAAAGITRIQDLLAVQTKIQSVAPIDPRFPLGFAFPKGGLALEFQNVSFGYDDAEKETCDPEDLQQGESTEDSAGPQDSEPPKEMVLHDISFQLRPGTVLGLLGRTGSGKTTLTRLIYRLYDPDEGTIRLGNSAAPGGTFVDVRQVPVVELRQRVGMVTQNIQLFHATVRDNLTFFDDSIRDEQILEVFQDLGIGEWYGSLSDGLDTELESGGTGLSAGEQQLLAFARIFLQDPGLVILDEASSRLDPATEHLIERAVDKLLTQPRRTAIIIAHRLGTVQRADEVMILEEGRVCEHGERVALASDPLSRFYSLLRTGMEVLLA